MRRRIRSAAFPVHRHSLPQLAVDGALVALAYYLAFQLRFDTARRRYERPARTHDLVGVAGSLPVLVLAALYQRRWRYSGQRDYEAVAARGRARESRWSASSRSSARCTHTASERRRRGVARPA